MSYYLEDHPNVGLPQYGWPRNRVSGVIGVHTAESGVYLEGADPGAENTAAYMTRRTSHGSYHIMADWDTIIPLVRPTFAAWADTTNNAHAMSVSGAMNAARWRDLPPERAAQIVRNMGIAAAMLVRDAIAHGLLSEVVPATRITAQEAINGSRSGFYGHGETNPGTRYDPGQNFDWDLFLSTYAAAVGGSLSYASGTTQVLEEIDVAAKDEIMARQDQHIAWENQRFNDLAEQAERNRNMLAGFVRDVVNAKETISPEQIDARFQELIAATKPEGQHLFKGDQSPEVYVWDGSSGFRHIDQAEYLTLITAGATLKELPQAIIEGAVK